MQKVSWGTTVFTGGWLERVSGGRLSSSFPPGRNCKIFEQCLAASMEVLSAPRARLLDCGQVVGQPCSAGWTWPLFFWCSLDTCLTAGGNKGLLPVLCKADSTQWCVLRSRLVWGDVSLLDAPILVRQLLLCVPKVNCRKTDNLKTETAEICKKELHYSWSTVCNCNISCWVFN